MMEWLTCVKSTIDYIEDNLLEIKDPIEVAKYVNMSYVYLQRGFQILSGYSLGEYIRNRRLYLAAIELINSDTPIIDIAFKYGYETPASFDKAFSRFHNATPREVRNSKKNVKSFLKLNISLQVQGGNSIDFKIEKRDSFYVIGFEDEFYFENSYESVHKYWEKMAKKYAPNLLVEKKPVGKIEEYIASHLIGEIGVSIDDMDNGKFHYMIAGFYDGKEYCDDIFTVRKIDSCEWAIFDCKDNFEEIHKAIWSEWLPGNSQYELAGKCHFELNSFEHENKTQIWIPVKSLK